MVKSRLSSQQRSVRRGGPDATRKVLYPIHAGPQTTFMTSDAEEMLYGGAAGGGKSYGLRAWAVTYSMVYPGANGVLFRQSFRQLEETHLIAIQQEVPESVAEYKTTSHDLIFPNGSIIHFRFCEKDDDVRCVGVDTPILTSDLRWVRAGDLKAGDELVGFDEEAPHVGGRRRLKNAVVTANTIVETPAYRIYLSDGQVIDATPEHPWLVMLPAGRIAVWRETHRLQVGQKLRRAFSKTQPKTTYSAGFLSAAFDGEGCLATTGGTSLSLVFTQKQNSMMVKVEKFLTEEGYTFKKHQKPNSDVYTIRINGGGSEEFRFLMEMRPPRLIDRWCDHLAKGDVSLPYVEGVKVIAIDTPQPRSIARLSTSTHTYLAGGQTAHNSYDTAEYDYMLFDELSHFTSFQYTYLTSRCRSTKSWWPGPRIRSGATPLGRGHAWVKERFVEVRKADNIPVEPMEIWTAPVSEGGMTRQFIPAKVTDNPTLFKSDPKYMDRLRALSHEEYRAKALGDWDVFTGQFFTRWRDQVHVVEPFDVPQDWDHFICSDYGFNVPHGVFWFARPPKTNTVFVYKEQYGKGIDLDEQVYRAWQTTQDMAIPAKAVVLDPAMFAKVNVKGDRVESMSTHWQKRFNNVRRGNNERVPGWRLMREMLDWQEKPDGGVLVPPRLFFFRTCSNAIRTIPKLIIDEHNPEDVDTDGEDHAADALRYGLRHAFEGSGRVGAVRRVVATPRGIVLT